MATLIRSSRPVTRSGPATIADQPVPPATTRRSATATVVSNSLFLAGALLLAFAGYLVLGSRLQAAHSQALLYGQLRGTLQHAVTPVAEPIAPGRPIALIDSPRLGGRQVVVEGTTSLSTMRGPGHRPGTPLPGQQGVSVIFGRSLTFGRPFQDLHLLKVGDKVAVTTGQGRFVYAIDSVRLSSSAFRPLAPAPSRLSLVTSDGSWSPDQTWVASGVLVAGTVQAGPALLAAPDSANLALAGDPSAGVPLLLWSQALLLIAVFSVWAWRRLPRAALWVGATPVVLAVLWNVFTNLSALFPNLL